MNDQKLPAYIPLTASDGIKSAPATGLSFPANVQHPLPAVLAADGSNDRSTRQPGSVTVSILAAPSGNALLVQVIHSDQTTLGLFLQPDTLAALRHCLNIAEQQLSAMDNINALKAAGQKPS